MDKNIIHEAASTVGGVVKLSLKLGLCRATVSSWRRVPPQHVLRVEALTGFSKHALRPDIYGPGPSKTARDPSHEQSEA